MIAATLDLGAFLRPKLDLSEILLTATVVYVVLVALLRFVPKRQLGQSSVNDLMFAVIAGGLAVEAMACRFEAPADGILMLLVVLMLSYGVDWLAFRWPAFRHWIQEPPTPLIEDGQVLHNNLYNEMITDEELAGELRRQSIENPADVKSAILESEGVVTVVPKPKASDTHPQDDLALLLAALGRLRDRLRQHQGDPDLIIAALLRHGLTVQPDDSRPVRPEAEQRMKPQEGMQE